MGRPSTLSDNEWAILGARIAAGEKAAALAQEFGVSKSAISKRFAGKPAPQEKAPAPPKERPRGRPSTFDQAIADEICARLSKGEPLAQICRDEHMPAVRTVSDWKKDRPIFSADFGRGRDDGFDYLAAQCLDIADETAFDTIQTDNGERANTEWIQRSKLRIETRLKLLAKWDPRRYGDKMQLTGDGGGPVETKSTLNVAGLSTAALEEIMKARDAAQPG